MKREPPSSLLAMVFFAAVGSFVPPTFGADQNRASGDARPEPYQAAFDAIAAAIETLKAEFPQLAGFSSLAHSDRDRLVIDYGYRTYRAHGAGWTSGVPNPYPDGVWFRIEFHDPASQLQIHTQPIVPRYVFRDKAVLFLMLEGEETESLSAAIWQILQDNGVTKAPNSR